MVNSIRWTLQLWHAALLTVVLIAFGVTAYEGVSRIRYDQIDSDLTKTAQLLAAGIHPMHGFNGGGGGNRGGGRRPFNGQSGVRFDRFDDRNGAPDAPPDDRGSPDNGRPGGPNGDGGQFDRGMGFGGRWPLDVEVDLPGDLQATSNITEHERLRGVLYFMMWDANGKVIKSTPGLNTKIVVRPTVSTASTQPFTPPSPLSHMVVINTRRMLIESAPPATDLVHEAYTEGPFGITVLVGQSVTPFYSEMHKLAILLATIGTGVLALGLVGGAILSARAVRPIRAIAQAAQEISATNLSRRIDVEGTQSELGELAAVMNDMFARLDSAFQQQIRFTADASHELRTPLAVIHTHAQLALSRERSPEEYRKSLATCLRASTRMKQLVDSLLLLAGADAGRDGRLTLEMQTFDLSDTVEECVAMATTLATESGVTIETSLESSVIAGDPVRLSQVIVNLLTNAIRYNRPKGSVSITLQRPVVSEGNSGDGRGEAVLQIRDTGIGIPSEHLPHVFDRFYRVDVARSREVGGSGLGLSICKSIVDAHGGTIYVDSLAGEWTLFTVRLPV